MLRNKEDLTRDRDSDSQQLDFTKKIDKEKTVEKGRRLLALFIFLTAGLSLSFWIFRFLGTHLKTSPVSALLSSFSKIQPPSFSKKNTNLFLKEPDLEPILSDLSNKEGDWSAYIQLLKEDLSWSKNPDLPLPAASLIKLPVILTYYQKVDQQEIDPQSTYSLVRQDIRSGAGSLHQEEPGYTTTYQNLAHLSLNKSDNTAYTALLRIITPQAVNEFIAFLQLTSTSLEKNTTSAHDLAKIFQYIYSSSSLSKESRKEIIDSLTNTAFEDRFPVGLPQGIHIAHKVGTETNAISDAGIVFTPDKDFILILMADNINPQKVESLFSKFAQDIYWELLNH